MEEEGLDEEGTQAEQDQRSSTGDEAEHEQILEADAASLEPTDEVFHREIRSVVSFGSCSKNR